MKSTLKIASILLLLFNGLGALYGGWHLINHPDGSSIQLSMDWLKYTPFKNYQIPGVILFIFNGLSSMIILATLIFKYKSANVLVMCQGAVLTGWIVIQMLLIRTVYFLHLVLGAVGLALLALGWWMRRIDFNKDKHNKTIVRPA